MRRSLSLNDFGSYLSDMMECPYCREIVIPPVYQCLTGHNVCGTCRAKMNQCGLCASAFAETRNFFHEALFEKTRLPCKYSEEGCKEKMLGKLLKAHQDVCNFRPIPCLDFGCANSKAGNYIPYTKYLDHCKRDGHFTIVSGHKGTVLNGVGVWNNAYGIHTMFEFNGRAFFAGCCIRQGIARIWLWFLGSEDGAEKYRVKITLGGLSNVNGCATLSTWEGPVHSIRKSLKEMMGQSLCMLATVETVKQLCHPENSDGNGGYWTVNFYIEEKKASSAPTPSVVAVGNPKCQTPL